MYVEEALPPGEAGAKGVTYLHKEAFCLMWYHCSCGHMERIWNSRDGVTPFFCTCPSCGSTEMRHVAWHLDQCAPNHKPHFGQRMWVNLTMEHARKIAARVQLLREAGAGVRSVEEVAERIYDDGKRPYLDVNLSLG